MLKKILLGGLTIAAVGIAGLKGSRSHRTLTNAGNKSERGPEVKDTP